MDALCCKAYSEEGLKSKSTTKKSKIGRYPILPNLIEYIKGQISIELISPIEHIDDYNDYDETENNNNDNGEKPIKGHNKDAYFNLYEKSQTAEIVRVLSSSSAFTIPASVGYKNKLYKITNICDNAFENSAIISLTFVEGSEIKTIGNYVFKNSQIQELFIPPSLEELGKHWCADAYNLSIIEVDESNTKYYNPNGFLIHINNSTNEILFGPPNIKKVFKIPKNFCIGSYSFFNNKKLQYLVSENLLRLNIGDHSFYKSQNLANVTLDSKVLNIEDCSFQESQKLESIQITSDELSIGNGCFMGCTSLTSITFNKIKKAKILSNAFVGCQSLKEFKITSSKLEIGQCCFSNAINLQRIEIIAKESLNIGENCFENCISLSSIVIQNESERNMIISKGAFEGCNSLISILIKSNSSINLNDELFSDKDKLETVSIFGNEVIIRNKCFYKSFNKTNRINIKSNKLIKIENNSFESSLIDNLELEGKKIIIHKESFNKCSNLQTIQITKSDEIFIEENSFNECIKLANILLESIKYININPNSFNKCHKLQQIDLKSTSNIDINQTSFYNYNYNFQNHQSSSITSDFYFIINTSTISYGEIKYNIYQTNKRYQYKTINKNVHVSKLTTNYNYYHYPIQSDINKSHHNEKGEFNKTPEEDQIITTKKAFTDKNNITYHYSIENQIPQFVYINNKEKCKITTICEKAFENSFIETLSFPYNSEIKTIGKYAFQNSHNLQKVNLTSSQLALCEGCFSSAINLQSVELAMKESLNIGEYCFIMLIIKRSFLS